MLLFSLGVFQHTHYLPVFLLILLYSLSVILIGFMITPFFDNSRVCIDNRTTASIRKMMIIDLILRRRLEFWATLR